MTLAMKRINKSNTLCLSMIVKNESKVIERCLKTVAPLIDYWIICDTGSTDDTIEIIQQFFDSVGIPGEIHQHEWLNYGHNRTLGLRLAKSKAQYTITIDADEEFAYADDLKLDALTCDHYLVLTDLNGNLYFRDLIFNNQLDWEFRDVLHEFPYSANAKTCGTIRSIIDVVHCDGDSHNDPEKYRKHAALLEQAIIERPDYPRYRYYLAQSYRDARMNEKAIENYLIRAQMKGGYQDEVYNSYVNTAYCMIGLEYPIENYLVYFFKAYELQSHRLEAPYEIVHDFLIEGMPKSAYNFGITIVNQNARFEIPDGLTIIKRLYDYAFLFEVYIAAYNSGNKQDAVRILKRILDEHRYPASMDEEFRRRWKEINAEMNPTTFTDIFSNIYRNNAWGFQGQKFELCSGRGNTFDYTINYREFLKKYINENGIRSVLDVGCGIWEFEHDEFANIAYTGIDCIQDVINFNLNQKYSSNDAFKNIKFICEDIFEYDVAAEYDMVIIKDFLQHMTNPDIVRLLDRLMPHAGHLLIVNDGNQHNDTDRDTLKTGDYAPLSYERYPLNKYNPVLIGEYDWKQVSVIRNDGIGRSVMIAILARNKGFSLQTYLSCIYALEYPKDKIILYINTNNNDDNTEDLLREFAKNVEKEYAKIIFEKHHLSSLKMDVHPHYWTNEKTYALTTIKNKSIRIAIEENADYYFIVDCDTFILPHTLRDLIRYNKPIIAPLLHYNVERINTEYAEKYSSKGCMKIDTVRHSYLINKKYIISNIANATINMIQTSGWICNDKKYGLVWGCDDSNITYSEEVKKFAHYLPELQNHYKTWSRQTLRIPNYTHQKDGSVMIAILARNKAHVLPYFLQCIARQDYPKEKIYIYINTNNNSDKTAEILEEWKMENAAKYAGIIFESVDYARLNSVSTNPHDWSGERFSILGKIREKSMQKAVELRCEYYFVVDCDNFIRPFTLRNLIREEKPIIAPMLRSVPEKGDQYSNFFTDIDDNGYFKQHEDYAKYYSRKMIGTFEVPVVHCTYLIRTEHIPKLRYIDGTGRYEFVIFSESARKAEIGQYICNKYQFGELLHFFDDRITLEEERRRFRSEYWFPNVAIIAMKTRKDRLKLLDEITLPILRKSGVKYELIDACDPTVEDVSDFINANTMKITGTFKTGQLGVYISHYRLWKRMVDEGIPEMIIFEDDAIIDGNFRKTVEEMIREKSDYEMIYFYHEFKNPFTKNDNNNDNEKFLQPGYETDGLVAYLITRKLAKQLVEHCRNMYREIDLVLKWYLTESGTRFYCSNRKMITHGLTESSINRTALYVKK